MESGPEPFGKYVLMERIAIGGMAEIFRARMLNGGAEDICIKRILPHYSEDDAFVNMFIDEASIAAKLQHENIVQIYDFDTVEGCYYIAMELIKGRDLKQTLEMCAERTAAIPPEVAMVVTQGLSRSLQYAHTKEVNGEPLNIVHRDVSPHNVMLSFDGEVKLTDFGIAKAASRLTTTRAGTVKGKCAYMSPEQARGKTLDGRSDIFSIGILMYEMLTGRRLFTGESDFDILTKVLKEPITPPSQFCQGLDPEIERICMKALERDRDLRYSSCAAMERDVNAWLAENVGEGSKAGLDKFLKALFGLTADPLPQAGGAVVSDELAAMADMKTAMFNREDFASPNTPVPEPNSTSDQLLQAGRTEAISTAPFHRDTVQEDPVSSQTLDEGAPSTIEMQPRLVVPSPVGHTANIHDEKTQAMDISQFTEPPPPDPPPREVRSGSIKPQARPNQPARRSTPIPQEKKKGFGLAGVILVVAMLGFFCLLLGGVGFVVFTQTDLFSSSPTATTAEGDENPPEGDDKAPENDGEGDGEGDEVVEGDDKAPEGDDKGDEVVEGDDKAPENDGEGDDKGDEVVEGDDKAPEGDEGDDKAPEGDDKGDDGEGDEVAGQNSGDDKGAEGDDKGDDKAPEGVTKRNDNLTDKQREERRKRLEEARRKRDANKGTATLVINAVPYADVTVDGRRRGRTPVSVKVSTGAHTVILSNPDKGKKFIRVKVGKGDSKKVFHLFK